jgi:DegV family protein with EDD domain
MDARIGIVTDSGGDLPLGLEKDLNIKTVPLSFRFGLEEFADKSMPLPEFFRKVAITWPTTSAPSPGDYIKAFRGCLEKYQQLVCFTLSSKHSASYTSALLASQEFAPGQVSVVDSLSLSIGQGMQVLTAARAAHLGDSVEDILKKVKSLLQRSHLYMVVDTVQYLVKGGRASQLMGFLAGILSIRPVLTLVDGQLTLLDRPRGRAPSKQKLLDLAVATSPAETMTVGHVDCLAEAREIASSLSQKTGTSLEEIPVVETGMAIATHAGPGTLGIMVVSKE